MKVDSPSSSQFFDQPAIRSYRFLVGTILLCINVAGGALMLVRHLDILPFGAAGCLVAGMTLLVSLWWRSRRHHERISLLMARKRESPEKLLEAALDVSA